METTKLSISPKTYFEYARGVEERFQYFKSISGWLSTPDTELEEQMIAHLESTVALLGMACTEQLVTVDYRVEGDNKRGHVLGVGVDTDKGFVFLVGSRSQEAPKHQVSLHDISAIQP
jgi:hypothetical protein